MLLTAHVGYTVGAAWLTQRRLSSRWLLDYRLLALMAILPDVVDRFLYICVLPGAESGRLVAHTILFNLVLIVILACLRRGLWLYGVAALGHLALDVQGLAPHHALWPLLGADLGYIGITGDGLGASAPLFDRIWLRAHEALTPYGQISRQALLWELGGLLVLVAFAIGHDLYRPKTFLRFLKTGKIAMRAHTTVRERV
jgi:hypothetical protein